MEKESNIRTQNPGSTERYRVVDSETGYFTIYKGNSIRGAVTAVNDSAQLDIICGEHLSLDIYDGNERIWSGLQDSMMDLEMLVENAK